MIKNIIFDIGDVLVYFRYREYMRDLGFSEELVEFFSEQIVLTPYWHNLDAGVVDDAHAVEYFQELFPQYKDEIELFWSRIAEIVEEFPYAKGLVSDLKKAGYKVYALSNYPDKLSDLHWATFTFLPDMDGYIISAKEKVAKPDPAIYHLLESKFGLTLSECVFIDDREANVETARSLGMKAVRFHDLENLTNKLDKMGVHL